VGNFYPRRSENTCLPRTARQLQRRFLARPGALTDARVASLPMTVVGYGSTKPIPRDSVPPPSSWDGIRRFRRSTFEKSSTEYWGTRSLPKPGVLRRVRGANVRR
jgi:hypothetical protein